MIEDNELEINLGKSVRIWWAFVWRATLFTFIASIVVGFIIGLIFGLVGKPEYVRGTCTAVGYLISIPISILVFRHILEKGYKNFRIVLVPKKIVYMELKKKQ